MGGRQKAEGVASCPHCKADIGDPCVSANGLERYTVHVSRAKIASHLALEREGVDLPHAKNGSRQKRKQPLYVEWVIHKELKRLSSKAGESMREVVHRALSAEILTLRRKVENER